MIHVAVMDPEHFSDLKKSLEASSSDDDRLSLVEKVCRNGSVFISEQCTTLLSLFPLPLAINRVTPLLWPRCFDVWNFASCFEDSDSLKSVLALVSKLSPLPSPSLKAGGPMDPVSFAALARRLTSRPKDFLLQLSFAVCGGAYFSTTQMRALVNLVRKSVPASSTDEKKELDSIITDAVQFVVRSSRIVDPSNVKDMLKPL